MHESACMQVGAYTDNQIKRKSAWVKCSEVHCWRNNSGTMIAFQRQVLTKHWRSSTSYIHCTIHGTQSGFWFNNRFKPRKKIVLLSYSHTSVRLWDLTLLTIYILNIMICEMLKILQLPNSNPFIFATWWFKPFIVWNIKGLRHWAANI